MLEALDAYGVGGVRKSIIQISPAAVVTTNRPAAGQKSKSLSMTSSPLKRRQVTGVARLSGSPCGIFIRLIFACHWPATLRQATCHKTVDVVESPGTSSRWEKSLRCPHVVDQTPGYQEGLEQT